MAGALCAPPWGGDDGGCVGRRASCRACRVLSGLRGVLVCVCVCLLGRVASWRVCTWVCDRVCWPRGCVSSECYVRSLCVGSVCGLGLHHACIFGGACGKKYNQWPMGVMTLGVEPAAVREPRCALRHVVCRGSTLHWLRV